MPHILYTDGGSRGNPGDAAAAAFLFEGETHLLDFDSKYLGQLTNNSAEYIGLIMGLKIAIKNNVKDLVVRMDSELIIKQLKGEYAVKNTDMMAHKKKVDALRSEFDKIVFEHVERAKNKFADKLLNLILDTHNL